MNRVYQTAGCANEKGFGKVKHCLLQNAPLIRIPKQAGIISKLSIVHAYKNAPSILLPDGVDTLVCQGEGFGGFLIHMGEDLDNELVWDDIHWRWSLSGESLPTALTIMLPSLPMRQYMLLIHLRGFAFFCGRLVVDTTTRVCGREATI